MLERIVFVFEIMKMTAPKSATDSWSIRPFSGFGLEANNAFGWGGVIGTVVRG